MFPNNINSTIVWFNLYDFTVPLFFFRSAFLSHYQKNQEQIFEIWSQGYRFVHNMKLKMIDPE